MDIKKLEIFCEVYRQKSFSRAAKRLKLTQSAVSQQIKAIENCLSVKLFDAENRTSPTAAGDYLYSEGVAILAQIADLENGIKHVAGFGEGTVRFGMIDVAAIWIVPGALGRFKTLHPKVKVEAIVKTSGELVELVEENALDFAVVVTNKIPDSLKKKHIYNDSIVAVVPVSSRLSRPRISIDDLKGEPLIVYPSSSHSRQLIEDAFRAKGIVPAVSAEMHYPAAILSLVRQGMGTGLVSELSAKELKLKGQKIVPIKELSGTRQIGIVFNAARRPSPQARALMDFMARP